jgi:hypothetical protein
MEGRMDKKVAVAPYVPVWMREFVHDVARFKRQPDGETARQLVLAGRQDILTLGRLAPYFWRSLFQGGTAWIGHEKHEDLSRLIGWEHERVERLKVRFVREDYKLIDEVAFALGRPFSHAVAALLTLVIKDDRIIGKVAPGFAPRSIYSLRGGTILWGSGQTRSSASRK